MIENATAWLRFSFIYILGGVADAEILAKIHVLCYNECVRYIL